MSAVYRFNANKIDRGFLDKIKEKFAGKNIKIIVSELDETEYLLSSEANIAVPGLMRYFSKPLSPPLSKGGRGDGEGFGVRVCTLWR
jgi:hypothetical protein